MGLSRLFYSYMLYQEIIEVRKDNDSVEPTETATYYVYTQ